VFLGPQGLPTHLEPEEVERPAVQEAFSVRRGCILPVVISLPSLWPRVHQEDGSERLTFTAFDARSRRGTVEGSSPVRP
jgi:hypothetical protein